MDLLTGSVRKHYFKYLSAAFGSALITSIYGIVDLAIVGQYHGPEGSAAMAVIAPVWNILYGFGLLTGIGGSVIFSTLRGEGQKEESDQFFSSSVIGTAILALLCWIGFIFLSDPLLKLFGAQEAQMPLARRYVLPVKFAVPLFLFVQLLSAFLRNDGDPGRATRAVIIGGIFNVFGDYFMVFTLNWGIFGAGVATCLGALLSVCIMLGHFRLKTNTLRWVKLTGFGKKLGRILATGFSTFFIDIAMGILTTLFNRQILQYLSADALSVYAVIINISTFVQCCAYSIGQAAQPILSVNFGAGKQERIRETLRLALLTSVLFGLIWTALAVLIPNGFIRVFMQPTDSILAIAPGIIRRYGISFLLLPLNVFSTYYFQAVLRPRTSFIVSVLRGAIISGALILILPGSFGADALWFAMPVTELLITLYVLPAMIQRAK
ncbi:MAG: polysaccharide biosynthesis C-terminal domain-containing protein [Clostridia bacterium]|nr:polysaccharide biosynthesis C-terminal domain-containing protein [Clostridia bacterium]